MTTIDLRNATFESLRQNLNDKRMEVYRAWVQHGPATTRQLANKSGIDILNVRPRTTDLCDLGLVKLVAAIRGHEGVYQAVPKDQWDLWLQDQLRGQQQLL